jgi:cytochrome c oxidase subunit 4
MSHDSHSNHHVNYRLIFIVLVICSILSFVFDKISMTPGVTLVLVMAVACTKATCVMMYFMHLKFEGNWKYVLLAPTTILAIGLPVALFPDIGASYYTSVAPQTTTWKSEIEEFKAHHTTAVEDETKLEEPQG